jgi:hypothetical protein
VIELVCKDFGQNPKCLREVDHRYTMNFDDVEPGARIYWCAHCGPEAQRINDLLMSFMQTAPREKVKDLEDAIAAAEKKVRLTRS